MRGKKKSTDFQDKQLIVEHSTHQEYVHRATMSQKPICQKPTNSKTGFLTVKVFLFRFTTFYIQAPAGYYRLGQGVNTSLSLSDHCRSRGPPGNRTQPGNRTRRTRTGFYTVHTLATANSRDAFYVWPMVHPYLFISNILSFPLLSSGESLSFDIQYPLPELGAHSCRPFA